ncbi:MAG: hypothetical protein KC615_18895 [Anaerolineae bacterium]|nr:hypothetical protein [Anaerolineae bacterium]
MSKQIYRSWGTGLLVLGLLFVLNALITESSIVDVIIGVIAILIGQALPLPPAMDAWIKRSSLLVRAGVALVVLVLAILLIGLIQTTGVSLQVVMPALFLVPGVVLLGMSRFSR